MSTLQPIDLSHFVKVADTEEIAMEERNTEEGQFGDLGLWNQNNGTITFVDENCDQWVGRSTRQTVDMLQAAGYDHDGGLWVPHSNDGGKYLRENLPE